jgi:hypothetical protein
MGASGWLVITPWQQDLAASLRTAQREIFTAGNFQDPLGVVADPAAAIARLDAFELPSDLPPEDRADLLAFLEEESAQQRSAIARYQSAQTLDGSTSSSWDGGHPQMGEGGLGLRHYRRGLQVQQRHQSRHIKPVG